VQESGAELLFLPIYYQEGALILQQASQMGIEIPVFGADGFDGILDQLGADNAALAEGVMLMTPFVATKDDAQTQNFVNTYADLYNGEVPNQFAADGYDAVIAIAKCFDSNPEMVNASISDVCEFLKEQMTEISIEGLTGNITWSSDGEPTKEPIVVKIANGAYEVL
ncbi:MAG: ABC transporter substrate-binding protein, partial [Oscillospiraceae bacterium]|nr:ABC transporter substrate-binding protein [Oscillospiraceae bacterium]